MPWKEGISCHWNTIDRLMPAVRHRKPDTHHWCHLCLGVPASECASDLLVCYMHIYTCEDIQYTGCCLYTKGGPGVTNTCFRASKLHDTLIESGMKIYQIT